MNHERAQQIGSEDRTGERGAIIPMTAILIVVMIVSVALSVDTGMIAHRKRDLRSVTDLVTLDVARIVDGSQTAAAQMPTLEEAAAVSAVRNGHDVADPTKDEEMTVVPGVWSSGTGFEPCSNLADCYPNAVRVLAGETVPRSFAFFASDKALDLAATGVNPYAGRGCVLDCESVLPCAAGDPTCTPVPCDPTTCPPTLLAGAGLTIGSFVGRFHTDRMGIYDGVVNGLLQVPGDQRVTGIGYRGLADAGVSLADLAAKTRFGTVEGLLDADVTASEVLAAAAAAGVFDKNGASSVELATDFARLASASTSQATFAFGEVYKLSVGDGAAASTSTLNAADLLFDVAQAAAAAELINSDNFATIDVGVSPDLSDLGVSKVTAELAVVEAPQRSSGVAERVLDPDTGAPAFDDAGRPLWQTRAETSQVVMSLLVELADVPLTVGGTSISSSLQLPLLVHAGSAVADLERIACDPLRTGSVSKADIYEGRAYTSAGKVGLGTLAASAATAAASSDDFGAVAATLVELTADLPLPVPVPEVEPIVPPPPPLGGLPVPAPDPVASPVVVAPVVTSTIRVEVLEERDLLGNGPSGDTFSFTDDFEQVHEVGGVDPVGDALAQLFEGVVFEPVGVEEPLAPEVLQALGLDGLDSQLRDAIRPLSGPLNTLIDDLSAGLGLSLGGADVLGGPRPFRFTGPDLHSRAADCPAPIPFLVE